MYGACERPSLWFWHVVFCCSVCCLCDGGGAVWVPVNPIRSMETRRWFVPLIGVARSVCGCWSMPAPTRRPGTMCVIGRLLVFPFHICIFHLSKYASYFHFSKAPIFCYSLCPFPVSEFIYCCYHLSPYFDKTDISSRSHLVLALCGAAANPTRRMDRRRWCVLLTMVTRNACGCWSMPVPIRMPWTWCVSVAALYRFIYVSFSVLWLWFFIQISPNHAIFVSCMNFFVSLFFSVTDMRLGVHFNFICCSNISWHCVCTERSHCTDGCSTK